MADSSFRPTVPWSTIQTRAALLQRMRAFFDAQGLVEVETPLLSRDCVIDRHLDPIPLRLTEALGHSPQTRFLQTSPEFAMKRLLAAGAGDIYQIGKAFRAGEVGSLHNPEFTMVEWYRLGDDQLAGIKFLGELVEHVLQCPPASSVSYREAFHEHVGLDPHTEATANLAAAAERLQLSVPSSQCRDDRDFWLEVLFGEAVQPHLGKSSPAIVFDYPASQAALAQVRQESPPVAERFELFINGLELANGYHELLDAEVLKQRNRQANRERLADGKFPLNESSDLVHAMESGLPACAGVALGFDRLVMVAIGATSIREVIPFPFDIA